MKYLSIHGTFWIDWSDRAVKIVPDEEANVDMARVDDEFRGDFHPQIPVKFKRFGYLLIIALLILLGCKEEYLNVLPEDKITDASFWTRSEEHTSELQSRENLV